MYEYIYSRAEAFGDQDLRNICIRELTDNKEKLMYYPAAQKNHHAEMGGLLAPRKTHAYDGRTRQRGIYEPEPGTGDDRSDFA